MKYLITVEGETFEVEVDRRGRVWVDHHPVNVDFQGVDGLPQYSLLVDHRSYEAHVERAEENGCHIVMAGHFYQAHMQGRAQSREHAARSPSRAAAARRGSLQSEVRAPLPGLVAEVRVAEGERVEERDVVAVVESMKMNLELRAPQSGVVHTLRATAGREVAQGEVLALIRKGGYDEQSPEQPAEDLPDPP